jgi:flagellar hook protein FlgE
MALWIGDTLWASTARVFETGGGVDLMIDGPGYFVLRDHLGAEYFTRVGNFFIEGTGYVVNGEGMRLQGIVADELAGAGNVDRDIRFIYDLSLFYQSGIALDAVMAGLRIDPDGRCLILLSDATTVPVGKILLKNLGAPAKAKYYAPGLVIPVPEALPTPTFRSPGEEGLGQLRPGFLELPTPVLEMRGPVGLPQTTGRPLYTGTEIATDLAIRGDGFFMLRDPTNNSFHASRAGAFYWDTNGFLVNYTGLRVQGYRIGSVEFGDVNAVWDPETAPVPASADARLAMRIIDSNGEIAVVLSDGIRFSSGQILLRNCPAPEHLSRKEFGLCNFFADANWTMPAAPGSGGFGELVSYAIDLSQCDSALSAARDKMNFFLRGPCHFTGRTTDLYIDGDAAMFTLRDPQSGELYATRHGTFRMDSDGYLVNSTGLRVQGLVGSEETNSPGDIVIHTKDTLDTFISINEFFWNRFDIFPNISGAFGQLSIRFNGSIQLNDADHFRTVIGQITLQEYADRRALRPLGTNLFGNVLNAAPRFPFPGRVAGNNVPTIVGAAVEAIPNLPELRPPSASAVQLIVRDSWESSRVEASEDLLHWIPLGDLDGRDIGGINFFDEANRPSATTRFYRLVSIDQQSPAQIAPFEIP